MNWLRNLLYRWLVQTYMPLNLYEIRHGESEGNKYHREHPEDVDAEFFNKLSAYYRLTDDGIARCVLVGEFLRSYAPNIQTVMYSPYSRAEETDYYFGIDVEQRMRFELEERLYGKDDRPRPDEDECERRERLRWLKDEPMLGCPDGGERIADTMMRYPYGTLHREYSDQNVAAFLHGETMTANVARTFRLAPEDLKAWKCQDPKEPLVHVENCQVHHWTRIDPFTGKICDHIEWVKVLRPWDPDFSYEWRRVERVTRTREQLRELFEQHPRHIA